MRGQRVGQRTVRRRCRHRSAFRDGDHRTTGNRDGIDVVGARGLSLAHRRQSQLRGLPDRRGERHCSGDQKIHHRLRRQRERASRGNDGFPGIGDAIAVHVLDDLQTGGRETAADHAEAERISRGHIAGIGEHMRNRKRPARHAIQGLRNGQRQRLERLHHGADRIRRQVHIQARRAIYIGGAGAVGDGRAGRGTRVGFKPNEE